MVTIHWFGLDLRLDDNPALRAAIDAGPVVPVYILDDEDAGDRAPGGASRWWLHKSLESLSNDLSDRGSRLVLRRGGAKAVIGKLVEETGAGAVHWNRRYEPWAIARNRAIKTMLDDRGIEARSFNAALIREPWTVETKSGDPYKVFTPFWKAVRADGLRTEHAAKPRKIEAPDDFPASDALPDWDLLPKTPDWAGGLRDAWTPGEAGAWERLHAFADEAVVDYHKTRDTPGTHGTSRLSPYLHFGEIGPRQIWRTVVDKATERTGDAFPAGVSAFLSELGWREFSHHLLYHFPHIADKAFNERFKNFPWSKSEKGLEAWRRGRTGYPIVDAGMRELWETGWMHNRVRMIVASFLTKHLLVPWQEGERWFWDTLVDADLPNNSAQWQWVAGSGADAAPYFRVFNPILQGEKFDGDGTYVRRWVPELADLPNADLHEPWKADADTLKDAGVELGRTYPKPIVEHKAARQRALDAYDAIKGD